MPVSTRARSRATIAAFASAAFLAGSVASVAGVASARGDHGGPAVPPANPTSADQIQNIDQVRTAIKAYYGDTVTTTPDPGDASKVLHEPAADGAWAKEAGGVAREITRYLVKARHHHGDGHGHGHKGDDAKKVLLLDVDDTSLVTYDYEISSNFAYTPASNAIFVNAGVFPAVAGMPQLAAKAADLGYQVIWLTGRPESQRAATAANLQKAGYVAPDADHLYLKDQTKPWLSSCAPTCTTVQYKSLTRKYIESQGYDIVANAGDQYSDLTGGYADRAFKLPNPMYYLP